MILGNVNESREAIVQLAVLDKDQKYQMVKAVVDTGYTGCLILPMPLIASMGLTCYAQQEGLLGDGSIHLFNVYESCVIWDGQVRTIEINDSEADPLIGMGLLEGYELRIEAIPGGTVTIQTLFGRN
jgi:clan AA aspartic protease